MINVKNLTDLQQLAVEVWHHEKLDLQETGFEATVLRQHRFNYELWHEEDIARSPDVSDAEIARVKRSIDRLNQQRNDMIEQLDAEIIETMNKIGVVARENAPLNTETPGSAIDRLSIMALRLYHLNEQLQRSEATEDHREKVTQRILRCQAQHADLSRSLTELLDDLFAGRKRLQVYHQFKMYNDPSMNPYLYNRRKTA